MADEAKQWKVPRAQTAAKAAVAALLAVIAVLGAGDRALLFLAGVGALGAAVVALRDVVAPVRLAADARGLTIVSGYAGRIVVPWPQVAAIRVDETTRYGLRIRLLEIETTAGDVHLLSRYDLGEDAESARSELVRRQARAAGSW